METGQSGEFPTFLVSSQVIGDPPIETNLNGSFAVPNRTGQGTGCL